jgi:nucleoside-diphosphate-sugar epimerase
MRATVFGAGGFIGRNLAAHLEKEGFQVRALLRGDESWRGAALGHVFFCIGLTADFRQRPLDALDAHVTAATQVLRHGDFESFLYLSSTRVYGAAAEAVETAALTVDPNDPSDLYNLSKLAGEAACLALPRPEVRIARLSNVFGPGMGTANFLGSVLHEARAGGRVRLGQALDSEKDYVAIDDVVRALLRIALAGEARLYNVASGRNTRHDEIFETLANLFGCEAKVAEDAKTVRFPIIIIDRLINLMKWSPMNVLLQIKSISEGEIKTAKTR